MHSNGTLLLPLTHRIDFNVFIMMYHVQHTANPGVSDFFILLQKIF